MLLEELVTPALSSQFLVSCFIFPPSERMALCLPISYSRALSKALREFMFFISTLSPHRPSETFWEMLASTLIDPFSMSPSDTPRYLTI